MIAFFISKTLIKIIRLGPIRTCLDVLIFLKCASVLMLVFMLAESEFAGPMSTAKSKSSHVDSAFLMMWDAGTF